VLRVEPDADEDLVLPVAEREAQVVAHGGGEVSAAPSRMREDRISSARSMIRSSTLDCARTAALRSGGEPTMYGGCAASGRISAGSE
jgi:hypothetical protein